MKIVCDTDFKHGTDQFHQGDLRTVSNDDGAYFVSNGWAHELGGEAAASNSTVEATLDVQSNSHATKQKVK